MANPFYDSYKALSTIAPLQVQQPVIGAPGGKGFGVDIGGQSKGRGFGYSSGFGSYGTPLFGKQFSTLTTSTFGGEKTGVTKTEAGVDPAKLKQIMSMGIPEDQATKMLQDHGGDMDKVMAYIQTLQKNP